MCQVTIRMNSHSFLSFDCSLRHVLQETSLLQAMSSVSHTRSGARRQLIRAIALLFLIYTGMDLASPDLCRGETLGDGRLGLVAITQPALTRDASSSVARIDASDNQPTNDPSDQPHDDDDCFCCCTHVLPGTVVASIGVTDLVSPMTNFEPHSVSSPPLARAFHPPRFA